MKFNSLISDTFQPFSIEVETQAEANFLYALVAATSHSIDSELGFDSNDLYDYLYARVNTKNIPDLDITIMSESKQ